MSVSWEALCEDIRRARPGSTLFYELIRLAQKIANEGSEAMSRQSRADAAAYAAIHDSGRWETMTLGKIAGSTLSGGGGRVPKSVSVGRKGQGKTLTKAEVKKIAAQQKADIKAARAAKRGKK